MKKHLLVCLISAFSSLLFAQGPQVLNSPEILPDNSVVFRLKAPDATEVKVLGTWVIDLKPIPMVKNDSGVFEVKVGPIASGMYEYRFLQDGTSLTDPSNKAITRDGYFVANKLIIPGDLGDVLSVKDVPHGNVSAVWYPSSTLGGQRRMYVYTPPGYNEGSDRYPVVYLLHGGGGDEDGWNYRGRANYIVDNLIASGDAVPMIVVITNGNPNNAAAPLHLPEKLADSNSGPASMASGDFEKSLVEDVVPYIEENYRVIADADHRAITGFSMGGFQTQNITNNNPEMFKYIGVMSMGLVTSIGEVDFGYNKEEHIAKLKALKAANPKLYWIGIGKADFLYETAIKLRAQYDEIGLKYIYRETEGNHVWNEWRLYFSELVPMFFK